MLNVYELNSGRIEQKLIFNLVKIIFSQEQCNPMDYEELLIKKKSCRCQHAVICNIGRYTRTSLLTRPILCVKLISWAFQDFDNKVERNQPFVAESITGHLHNGHRQAPPENNIGILLADDQMTNLFPCYFCSCCLLECWIDDVLSAVQRRSCTELGGAGTSRSPSSAQSEEKANLSVLVVGY